MTQLSTHIAFDYNLTAAAKGKKAKQKGGAKTRRYVVTYTQYGDSAEVDDAAIRVRSKRSGRAGEVSEVAFSLSKCVFSF
jgi:hypothetical protein